MHEHKQPEIKEKSFISHVPNPPSLFPLYFTYLLLFLYSQRHWGNTRIVPFLERRCCSDYELPAPNGTGIIKLPVGTGVYILVLGIHFDPTYLTRTGEVRLRPVHRGKQTQ